MVARLSLWLILNSVSPLIELLHIQFPDSSLSWTVHFRRFLNYFVKMKFLIEQIFVLLLDVVEFFDTCRGAFFCNHSCTF